MKWTLDVFVTVGVAVVMMVGMGSNASAETKLTQTPRGVRVETPRYRAVISNGVLRSFINRHTEEEYLYENAQMDEVLPHLPGGLGTQNGDDALDAAAQLYDIPWNAHSPELALPNQHYPTDESTYAFAAKGQNAAVLTYRGLFDGAGESYSEEKYLLRVEVDDKSGDLMLTPSAVSPNPGVYAANLVIAPVDLGITVEAPIWDGIRLTHDMPDRLWRNRWPSYWDYQFVALNGRQKGAVGIWAADPDLLYKDLFYLVNDEGISLSLSSMNIPPFGDLKKAEGRTWHIQAYDRHWSQAAADYREWREENMEFAARPDWAQEISFVNNGVNAGKMWLEMLSNFFGGKHLERTVTFAATIRAANFDTMHYDNTPYEGFKEDMKAWHQASAHLMAYLNPMTMWGREGAQHERTEQDRAIMDLAHSSDTTKIFAGEDGVRHKYYSKHHLGYPEWRQWFVEWINAYIQEYGADGVYNDETYIAPVDNRGLVDGMTPPQALADYFLEIQRDNPDAIFGTEHLQEANLAAASLGIGAGVHWGTVKTGMRMQRIHHPSAVSAALAYPHGVIWGFPHQSHFSSRGDMTKYHWGMDQRERRAQIPGFAIQRAALYRGKNVPFQAWENELKLDRRRALTFVHQGLRPVFPQEWDRSVFSYFEDQKGTSYRYEKTSWGSRFVKDTEEGSEVIYGRIHGVPHAETDAGIYGWLFYNDSGPAGLYPERYYPVWPEVRRPEVRFSGSFPDAYVAESFGNDVFSMLSFASRPDRHNVRPRSAVTLSVPSAPELLKVDGKSRPLRGNVDKGYRIPVKTDSSVVVFHQRMKTGVSGTQKNVVIRAISDVGLDVFDPNWLTENEYEARTVQMPGYDGNRPGFDCGNFSRALLRFGRVQALVPFRAPEDEDGTFRLWVKSRKPLKEVTRDGMSLDVLKKRSGQKPIEVNVAAGEAILLGITAHECFTVGLEWETR